MNSPLAQQKTVWLPPRSGGGDGRREETRLELLEVLATTAHARLRAQMDNCVYFDRADRIVERLRICKVDGVKYKIGMGNIGQPIAL